VTEPQAKPYATVAALFEASSDASSSVFLEAAKAAGINLELNGTLFVPTDEAFGTLLTAIEATQADLMAEEPLVTAIMQFHVAYTLMPGMTAFAGHEPLVTLFQGQALEIDSQAGGVLISGAINTASVTTLLGLVGDDQVRRSRSRRRLPGWRPSRRACRRACAL
jgi:uncharacterized surface protein with fasciclin (FAS1) repeats